MDEAFAEVRASFDRFCLAAGIEALGTMMEADVVAACGPRHDRDAAALLDSLVSRGLDPTVPRLFIADGAKALSKAIRRTFGPAAAIQRCQIHKARNIMERLPKEHHAATRRVLRQAWELDDADKAEKLIRNLARRLDQQWPGVAVSILEGLDKILTVVRLTLPKELRRSLACTNIAENMMGTIRRVTRNVKRWRDAGMALRWVAAGMIEANKGFRRLKAHKQLSVRRAAFRLTTIA
ncbi:transposase-like protein [Bradyrhizobium japonicum]